MLKRLLVPLVAIATFAVVHAADNLLRADHPDHYVVQRGDTLWDIAARFLRAPWLWPEIWQANPQVANPHLIYPGDILNLSYLGGRPQLSTDGPQIRESDAEPIPALPLSEIEPFLKRMRVLEGDAWKGLPYVAAVEENRLMTTEAGYIYVRGLRAEPGERVAIVRPTVHYRERPKRRTRADDRETDVRTRPWHAVHSIHAGEGTRRPEQLLGYEVMEVAHAQVIRGQDPMTLLVDDGRHEVKPGDLILPVDLAPFDLYFHPHAPDSVPDDLVVMAITESLAGVGKYQVVALNRGARDGIANGQVYSVFRPGELIRDRVRYPNANPLRDSIRDDAHVLLPEEFAGHVMVFRVFNRMSYALVMEGQREIKPRYRLHAPYNL